MTHRFAAPHERGLHLSRRAVCGFGLAALSPAPVSATIGGSGPARLAVYRSGADTIGFVASARQAGIPAHAVSGDVSKLWEAELRSFWQQPGAELLGVTTLDTLFCLDLFGRDAGQRLVHAAPLKHDGAASVAALLRAAGTASTRHELDVLPHAAPVMLYAWLMRRKPAGAWA